VGYVCCRSFGYPLDGNHLFVTVSPSSDTAGLRELIFNEPCIVGYVCCRSFGYPLDGNHLFVTVSPSSDTSWCTKQRTSSLSIFATMSSLQMVAEAVLEFMPLQKTLALQRLDVSSPALFLLQPLPIKSRSLLNSQQRRGWLCHYGQGVNCI
jgi:hypothetical protein